MIKIITSYLLFILVFCGLMSCQQDIKEYVPVLVPWPQDIDIKSETINIGSDLLFVNHSDNSDVKRIIRTCINDFEEIGFRVNAHQTINPGLYNVTKVNLFLEKDESGIYGEEGYRLNVDEDISVFAATTTGLFWGTRTVLQLLQDGPDILVPELNISDYPAFGYRGFMIGVDRQFHTMDFHLQNLKKMSAYKLNHYMVHFSGRDSYTLPSDIYPQLPAPGKHYTKDEIHELVETAMEYNITIVPSVDVPGHTGALINALPELNFDDKRRSLNIAREETYDILQSIFEELMELFPGPIWHLGADEVRYPDLRDSPGDEYTEWMIEHNLTKGDQLLNYFINRMYEFIKGKGYRMFVWEGFDPNIEPKVDPGIIVCPFDIKFEGRMPQDYMDAGYTILNTSWTPLYIANKTSMTTPETFAKWNAYMFGAGRSPQPFNYWEKFSPSEIPTEIIGAQMCVWDIEEKAEWGLLFGSDAGPGFPDYGRPGPRIQIFSERIWTGDKTTAKDLLERTGAAYWD